MELELDGTGAVRLRRARRSSSSLETGALYIYLRRVEFRSCENRTGAAGLVDVRRQQGITNIPPPPPPPLANVRTLLAAQAPCGGRARV